MYLHSLHNTTVVDFTCCTSLTVPVRTSTKILLFPQFYVDEIKLTSILCMLFLTLVYTIHLTVNF